MKKVWLLSRKAFTDSGATVMAGSIAVFAIILLHMVVYPEYGDLQSMQYPEALSGLFGEAGSIGLVEGYIAAVSTNCLALVAILAVIIGTSATAGEEGAGTLDLMLAQPVRRRIFLLAKAGGLTIALSVVTLAAVPAFLLGNLRADVSVSGLGFLAASASAIPAAVVFLSIALLAGATLPSRGSATTAAAGAVLFLYFVTAAGAIGPLETVRKISPFYWADASHVLIDGFDWLRSMGLTAVGLGLCIFAAFALERRDISAGRREPSRLWLPRRARLTSLTEGATADTRLGGAYSRRLGIVRKTIADIRGPILATSAAAFVFAWALVLIYPSYRDALKDFEYPGALKGLLGEAGSFASPEGFMASEFFGFVPLILIAIAITFGTGATAGEESAGTLDVLLSQPVNRRMLLIHKAAPISSGLVLAAACGIPGYLIGRLFANIDLPALRFAAATANASLLTLLFLALALWAGAAFPSRGSAAMFVSAVVVAGYILNTLSFTIDWLQTPNKFSPFYWADASHVLVSGFDWLRAAALALTAAAIFLFSLRAIEHRDIVTGRRDWQVRELLRRRFKSRHGAGKVG